MSAAAPLAVEVLKTCHGPCGKELPAICFGLDRSRADGRNIYCPPCTQQKSRNNRARLKTLDLRGRQVLHRVARGKAPMKTEDETEVAGMTNEEIDQKHIRLRGSLKLKYPVNNRCLKTCGQSDYLPDPKKPAVEHPCFLAVGHKGSCQFSSECWA